MGLDNVASTAVIAEGAVIGEGTVVGPYCVIGPAVVLGRNNNLKNHVTIEGPSRIGDENLFFPGSSVGTQPQDLKYAGEPTDLVVGDKNIFRECVTVNRGTVGGGGTTTVGSSCLFMAYAHVAHDCHVGDNVIMANCATLAGHVIVEDYAAIGGLTPVHQFVRIGAHAFIGGATRISKDILPYVKMGGIPPVVLGANSIGLRRQGLSDDAVLLIERATKLIFQSGFNTTQAVDKIKAELPDTPEIRRILDFVAESKRGILR